MAHSLRPIGVLLASIAACARPPEPGALELWSDSDLDAIHLEVTLPEPGLELSCQALQGGPYQVVHPNMWAPTRRVRLGGDDKTLTRIQGCSVAILRLDRSNPIAIWWSSEVGVRIHVADDRDDEDDDGDPDGFPRPRLWIEGDVHYFNPDLISAPASFGHCSRTPLPPSWSGAALPSAFRIENVETLPSSCLRLSWTANEESGQSEVCGMPSELFHPLIGIDFVRRGRFWDSASPHRVSVEWDGAVSDFEVVPENGCFAISHCREMFRTANLLSHSDAWTESAHGFRRPGQELFVFNVHIPHAVHHACAGGFASTEQYSRHALVTME